MSRTHFNHPIAPISARATETCSQVNGSLLMQKDSPYSGIEQASADTEKDPHIDSEREAERQCNVQQC